MLVKTVKPEDLCGERLASLALKYYMHGNTSPDFPENEARTLYAYAVAFVHGKKLEEDLDCLHKGIRDYLQQHHVECVKTKTLRVGGLYFIKYRTSESIPILATYKGKSKTGASYVFEYIKPYYKEGQQLFLNIGEATVYSLNYQVK